MTKISYTLKNFLRSLFLKMGYRVTKIGTFSNSEYEIIQPFATFSPWNMNKKFLSTYKIIEKNTLVDMYRCYELWTLIDQIKNLDGCIIEIGVWRAAQEG